jgi:hypothetical protein
VRLSYGFGTPSSELNLGKPADLLPEARDFLKPISTGLVTYDLVLDFDYWTAGACSFVSCELFAIENVCRSNPTLYPSSRYSGPHGFLADRSYWYSFCFCSVSFAHYSSQHTLIFKKSITRINISLDKLF